MSKDRLSLLENSGILCVSGKDASNFLQGYITSDILTLSPESWQPGAFCNLQGRMVSNFRMVDQAGLLLIKMNKLLVDVTHQFLQKYIVFSKAETLNQTDAYCQVGVSGENVSATLKTIFGEIPEGSRTCAVCNGHIILSIPGEQPRYELWLKSDTAAPLLNELNEHLTPEDYPSWELQEIQAGWVWITPATSEQYIPQMMNLQAQSAISFDKGCYLGQEIVARMQYLGQLKQRMHRFRVTTDKPLEIGDQLLADPNKEIGKIVAYAAEKPDSGTYEILAVVRDAEDKTLTLESGEKLEQLSLPYVCAS